MQCSPISVSPTSLAKWRESLLQVNALVHAVGSFPESTPKRWALISQLVCLAKEWESTETAACIELSSRHTVAKGITN